MVPRSSFGKGFRKRFDGSHGFGSAFHLASLIDTGSAPFAANVGDHIAAAAHNLGPDEGRFLEHAVFGSGLTERSVLELAETARELWQAAFEQMVREATTRFEQDRDASAARMRMRFGAYFFSEPDDDTVASAGQEPVAP